MLKKLSHFLIGRTLFSLLLAGIIFFLGVTVRWKHENKQIYKLVKRRKKPYIIISWHEHIIGMTWNLPRPITTLNSPHSDGKILGKAIKESKINRDLLTISTKGGIAWDEQARVYKNSSPKYIPF